MATTVADIRNGLVANLAAIQDPDGKPELKPYRQASPMLPSVQVTGFDEGAEPTTFRGGFSITMLVQAFAGKATDQGAQERLDAWLYPSGTGSIWAALESDPKLGNKVDDLMVTRHDGTQIAILDNQTEALMATWHVQIEV